MKKWYRYLAAGVLVLLTLCVAGCGGVSHKSPEKVTEELIQSYTDGKEKKVKECYNQADNTEADLQTEIVVHVRVVVLLLVYPSARDNEETRSLEQGEGNEAVIWRLHVVDPL